MIAYQNAEVEQYVEGLEPHQKKLVLEMREAVLSSDDRVKEGIKWGSVAFFNNSNICGYRVAKKHVTLLFMEGASLNDKYGILAGNGAKARTYKAVEGDEINAAALSDLVQQALENGQ